MQEALKDSGMDICVFHYVFQEMGAINLWLFCYTVFAK